jgi:uridine kinase
MPADIIDDLAGRCLASRSLFIMGVDGCGGSGKSELAGSVRAAVESKGRSISVVHMDDFYFPSAARSESFGDWFDWQRLRDQVLVPLRDGKLSKYQRYDWLNDALADWCIVVPGISIVEGVYATRLELAPFYDLRVWVECPRDVRLARGLTRDGESARRKWEEEWMPAEDRYVREQSPQTRADILYCCPFSEKKED